MFRNYYAGQAAKDDTATAAAKATVTATLAKTANAANQYQSNAADQAVTVTDLNNLTNAQRTELTQFAANLINQMRTQMGNLPVKITQSAIDFANDVAKRYVADKMSGQGHDVAGIEATAATYGLRSGLGLNLYEDLSWGYIWNAQTMNDLKQGIYNTFVDMVANDQGSDFGHADSLTGYNLGTDRDMQQYLGISIDNLGQIHILMVKDSPVYIVDATKFNTTNQIAVNPATTTNVDQAGLTATLAQQNAALTAAKQAVTAKQGQLKTAQGQQAAAQTALDQVNADLARLNQQLVTNQSQLAHLQDQKVTDAATIKTAPAKLAALQAQLASDVQALQAAQPELTNALNTLAAAKTVAAQKHVDLNQINQMASQLQMRLDTAKDAVQANQAVLAALQQQLANYQNAPAILAAAQLAYEQADANLATVQTALSQAAAVLAATQRTSGPAQVDATAPNSTTDQPENVVHFKRQAQPARVSLPAVKAAANPAQHLTADQTPPQTDEQAPAAIRLLGLAVLGLVRLGYAELRRKFN